MFLVDVHFHAVVNNPGSCHSEEYSPGPSQFQLFRSLGSSEISPVLYVSVRVSISKCILRSVLSDILGILLKFTTLHFVLAEQTTDVKPINSVYKYD